MEIITDLNEIDRSTKEGRLLFAALIKIATESQTDKTLYEILEQLEDLATKAEKDAHDGKFQIFPIKPA